MKSNCHKKCPPRLQLARRRARFNSHELALQPWFLPRASRLAINSLIPPHYRNKMRFYFEDYGCMVCGKHDLYDANGMCLPCHHLVRRRIQASVRRLAKKTPEDGIEIVMKRRKALASKLLGPFSQPQRAKALRFRLNPCALKNPVDEALTFLTPGSRTNRELVSRASDKMEVLGKSVRDIRAGRTGR